MPAGLVAHQRAFLSETPLADVTGERTLAGVSPAVFVQTGCNTDTRVEEAPAPPPPPPPALTLCPEGLPAEVTLVRPLAAVDAQVDVEVVLLGEGVAAQAAQEGTLVPGGGEGQRTSVWAEPLAGSGRTRRRKHLWMALMCMCRPLRLDARWPHSSHTNGFSPRCLAASCTRSSVRVRKVLGHSGHCGRFQQAYTLCSHSRRVFSLTHDSPRGAWGDRGPSSCAESNFSCA